MVNISKLGTAIQAIYSKKVKYGELYVTTFEKFGSKSRDSIMIESIATTVYNNQAVFQGHIPDCIQLKSCANTSRGRLKEGCVPSVGKSGVCSFTIILAVEIWR